MRCVELFTEPPSGYLAITKVWGNVGGIVLSAAFLRLAWTREIGYDAFLGYAFALAVVTSPALASKLMGLRYGHPAANNTGAAKEVKP